jgi:RNA-splicing ligase RtcB
MLSEMVQSYFDRSIGLRTKYISLMQELIKDPEIRRYAEEWMDHSLRVFKFASEEYWADMKKKMRGASQ